MGRESKFLLSLLGLLAGIFVTALALRLFIPRPPEGAGPDIHTLTFNPFAETVPPPDLTPSPEKKPLEHVDTIGDASQTQTRFPNIEASFEPSFEQADQEVFSLPAMRIDDPPTLETVDKTPADETPAIDPLESGVKRFPDIEKKNAPWQKPKTVQTLPEAPLAKTVDNVNSQLPLQSPPIANSPPQTSITKPTKKISPGMLYDVQEGDSWWQLAEIAYGDGRYYRSLFAWNKTLQPRVSLSPGTTLEIPQTNQLQLAWPKLIPAK